MIRNLRALWLDLRHAAEVIREGHARRAHPPVLRDLPPPLDDGLDEYRHACCQHERGA